MMYISKDSFLIHKLSTLAFQIAREIGKISEIEISNKVENMSF